LRIVLVSIWEKVWLENNSVTGPTPNPSSFFLLAQVNFEPKFFPYGYPSNSIIWSFYIYLPMKMEQTECSETSAYKIQKPGNYPEEKIQHTKHGENLKSRIIEYKILKILPEVAKLFHALRTDGRTKVTKIKIDFRRFCERARVKYLLYQVSTILQIIDVYF
jgi:hypothetical protein